MPIYSISSWVSLISFSAAQWLDPIRDVYEAFTIYTFFQLLINYLGGERNLIITTHGRAPVNHLWPLDRVLSPVDISDPYTFLAIKRGILQYAWLKPVLGISAIVMKATGTYKEGYIDISSGYLWSGIIYNVSVTLSLYSLGLFWVCMHDDLKPFRPMPKFLCIKLIIFASYWQGFALSILVWLGAIPDNVEGYTQDNLAAAIQDALICLEMPIFAIAHWYAFSWHDYADNRLSAARLPVWYAVRDAFGPRDLIEDTKETFSGDKYKYRQFDSNDKILAHEDSKSRLARLKAGMRYERGGRGKYWLPNPHEINEHTSLLQGGESSRERSQSRTNGTLDFDEPSLDPGEEDLYKKAKKMEFGDWNVSTYPDSSCRIDRHTDLPLVPSHHGQQALPRPLDNTTTQLRPDTQCRAEVIIIIPVNHAPGSGLKTSQRRSHQVQVQKEGQAQGVGPHVRHHPLPRPPPAPRQGDGGAPPPRERDRPLRIRNRQRGLHHGHGGVPRGGRAHRLRRAGQERRERGPAGRGVARVGGGARGGGGLAHRHPDVRGRRWRGRGGPPKPVGQGAGRVLFVA